MLLQFTPAEADALPAEMKDPDGYYYAGRVINMIVAYNTGVATKPTGWESLLNPEYAGKLGFPTPLRSGAAQASVKTLTDAMGWKYFEKFKEIGGVQVKNNSTMRDQLATGELMAGALLDYMVRGAKARCVHPTPAAAEAGVHRHLGQEHVPQRRGSGAPSPLAYGLPPTPGNLTLDNFRDILMFMPSARRAIRNSVLLAISAATTISFFGALIAYIVVKTRLRGCFLLDFLATMPYAIPGSVVALAMILAWLRPIPLTNIVLYNTIWILLVAYIARYLTFG